MTDAPSFGSRVPPREIRVMFVHRWGAIMAGGEVWIKNLAEHLRTQGVTISAAIGIRGPLYSALMDMGVSARLVSLDFLRANPRGALVTSGIGLLRSARQVQSFVRTANIQIIHAFSPESAEVAFLASRLAHVPLVVTIMNCGPYPKIDGYFLRRAEMVVAISRAVEADLLDLGLSPERVVRVPIGIVHEHLSPNRPGELRRELGVPVGTPLIGMVATLERKKAQDTLLRAVPAVLEAFPDAAFALLGGDHDSTPTTYGPYEAELRQLSQSLGIAHKVHFLGYRPNAAALIADFDISVLCSRREALGLAAVESLTAGVPLVATAVEGLREVVEDGVTGLLVPPDDPQALAARISTLLGNRAVALELAATGQRVVRQLYDAASLALRNRELYESLLQREPDRLTREAA